MQMWQLLLIYVAGVLAVLYFISIRPAKRKNQQMRTMHASIKEGDRVMTIGGLFGTVASRNGEEVTVMIDPNTQTVVRVAIYAIQSVVESI